VRDVDIRAGDQLALFFASANRDEEVFEDPFAFRVDRRPNPHLAFGFGEHFCLGAHLGRSEIETMFRYLIERLDAFELAGSVERLASAVNGSIKHLPLRYRFV
jgi:cytochrome P450